jgi:hypothetical protein
LDLLRQEMEVVNGMNVDMVVKIPGDVEADRVGSRGLA